MFKSIEKTALQEIGPRFTLKLKWLRKGLPAVTGGASTAVPVAPGVDDEDEEDEDAEEEEGGKEAADEDGEGEGKEVGSDEEGDDDETAPAKAKGKQAKRTIPPLNQQGEFEWQWKVRPSAWRDHLHRIIADRLPLPVCSSRNSRRRARRSSSSLHARLSLLLSS